MNQFIIQLKINLTRNQNHVDFRISWWIPWTMYSVFDGETKNIGNEIIFMICFNILLKSHPTVNLHYGSTGCWVFRRGIQNWKDVCLKINIPKGNYWILRIDVTGRCQKVSKFDFQSHFSMSKIIGIFHNFFFIEFCTAK